MRRFLLTAATAASALVITACGDVTGIRRDLEGTYVLETVNGASLPEWVDALNAEVVSGEVTLYDDGTYEDEIRLRFEGDPFVEPFTSFGTYSVTGDEIRFNPNDPDLDFYYMEWDRDRLTQREPGLTLVYRR
jgi:hypothetical protein